MRRAYLSIFRIRAAESLQYRLAAMSGALVSIFWVLIEIVVYMVFYKYADNRFNFTLTLQQVVTYTWVKELMFAMLTFTVDDEIKTKIINGDVGVEMCRPLDIYWHWFAKTSAGRVGTLAFRSGMVLIAGVIIPGTYGFSLPDSIAGFLLFLLSVCCAFLLCTSFGMLVTAVRLGITWGEGPTYILLLIGHVMSGGYLPLQLWPDFMQTFLLYQPFAGQLDIPARLYVGSMAPGEAAPMLLLQLGWAALFIALGRLIMARRLRGVIVQGG